MTSRNRIFKVFNIIWGPLSSSVMEIIIYQSYVHELFFSVFLFYFHKHYFSDYHEPHIHLMVFL
jgi:hypothetical protein